MFWLRSILLASLAVFPLLAFGANNGKSMLTPESVLDRQSSSVYNSIGRVVLNVEHELQYNDPAGDRLSESFGTKEVMGTGVLITPCLLSTAQHVIHNTNNDNRLTVNKRFRELKASSHSAFEFFIHSTKLFFNVGKVYEEDKSRDPKKFFADKVSGNVVAVGHSSPSKPYPSAQSIWTFAQHNDWALIKLDRPVSGDFKSAIPRSIDKNYLMSCPKIVMAGFPLIKTADVKSDDRNLRSPTECKAVGDFEDGENSFFLDCINEPGASGSPIFCVDGRSDPAFIGIAVATDHYGPKEEIWTYVVNFNNNEDFFNGIQEFGACPNSSAGSAPQKP